MPTLLDEHLVSDALTGLTDWSGEAGTIRRTVNLTGEQADRLLAAVAETAGVLGHRPGTAREGGRVTFTLTTPEVNGVSELDIALASRINDLVDQARGRTARLDDGIDSTPNLPEGEATAPSRSGDTVGTEDPLERAGQGEDLERGGPTIGARAGSRDTPGVPLPDSAPGEPEPGVSGPGGQGGTTAAHTLEEPDEADSPHRSL